MVVQQQLAPGTREYPLPTHGLQAGLYWVQAMSLISRRVSTLVIP
jgi:hypothetical protein